jgi:hypothetical protein
MGDAVLLVKVPGAPLAAVPHCHMYVVSAPLGLVVADMSAEFAVMPVGAE